MAEIGWTPMSLPSRGALYRTSEGAELIPDGVVNIRKLTVKEESILIEQGAGGAERIGILLRQCCQLPEAFVKAGLKHEDLLITDRFSVLLALRTLTMGSEYTFNWKCSNCNAQNKSKIDIVKELNEDTPERIADTLCSKGRIDEAGVKSFVLQEPIALELPDAKVTVKLRFLRGVDEEKMTRYAKRMQSQNNPLDSLLMFRLSLQIVAVNDEKLSGRQLDEFIRTLTMRDSRFIDVRLSEQEPGIDMTVFLDCRSCGTTNEMGLPMTAEFFRPTDV